MAHCTQFILKLFVGTVFLLTLVSSETFDIAISHCNDVNGQLEAFQKDTHISSKAPQPCNSTDGENCIGGLTNLVHWLNVQKGDDFNFTLVPPLNLLKLSSGNLIGGESGWIAAVETGWKDYAALIKDFVKPTFTALGMKEFGAGLRQTVNFIKDVGGISKIGVGNTCENSYTGETEKEFCDLITQKYTKVALQATRATSSLPGATTLAEYEIGIIGFVTPNVERLSLPGELKFSDISESIKAITEKVNADENIKTFIAVGDGNLDISKEIIDKVPAVKLVIYGSGLSNTNINDYPLKYKESFIATAGRYGSSVGKLHLQIDSETGGVTLKDKQLIDTVKPDNLDDDSTRVKAAVDTWGDKITEQKKTPIGNSRVDLVGGETCWKDECNIGNLMTDAVVHCVLNRFNITDPFPNILHSIWHGGAFFEDTVNGLISEFDVHKWLPYHNNVHLVKVKGSDLIEVFEASAKGIDPDKFKEKDWRQFLQVSNGFQVFYDISSDTPEVTVRIVHDDVDGVPKFTNLDNEKEYHLAIPTYLYEGRGVYGFAKEFWKAVEIPPSDESGLKNVFDDECLEGYIKAMKHISVGLEERIWIVKEGESTEAPGTTDGTGTTSDITGEPSSTTNEPCPTDAPATPAPCPKRQKAAVTVTLTIVFYTIILAISYIVYFYVLPRLRRPPISEQYPPNQL